MSLTHVRLATVVKKQYIFKLKAYHHFFATLIVLQLIGMLFSLGGIGASVASSMDVDIMVTYYSADQLLIFTMFWIFMSAVLITTVDYHDVTFTFVTNRLSNHLANTLFLMTASLIGGVTAYLGGFLIKIATRFFDSGYLVETGLPATWLEFVSGCVGLFFILFLLGLCGYLAGILIRFSTMFIVIIAGSMIGFFTLSSQWGEANLVVKLFAFYFQEASLLLFSLKMVGTAVMLLLLAVMLANRQEVRT